MEVFHEFLLSIKLDLRFRLISDGERLHAEISRLDFLGIGNVRQMEKLELFRRVRSPESGPPKSYMVLEKVATFAYIRMLFLTLSILLIDNSWNIRPKILALFFNRELFTVQL